MPVLEFTARTAASSPDWHRVGWVVFKQRRTSPPRCDKAARTRDTRVPTGRRQRFTDIFSSADVSRWRRFEVYHEVFSRQFTPLDRCPTQLCRTNKTYGKLSMQVRHEALCSPSNTGRGFGNRIAMVRTLDLRTERDALYATRLGENSIPDHVWRRSPRRAHVRAARRPRVCWELGTRFCLVSSLSYGGSHRCIAPTADYRCAQAVMCSPE